MRVPPMVASITLGFGAGAFTVTVQVASLSPTLAVMVASPAATAVTTPFSTVATAGSEDSQVTVLSVALSGLTVAAKVAEPPISRVSSLLSSVTDSTATAASFTLILT